jgi:hypothetical protein
MAKTSLLFNQQWVNAPAASTATEAKLIACPVRSFDRLGEADGDIE